MDNPFSTYAQFDGEINFVSTDSNDVEIIIPEGHYKEDNLEPNQVQEQVPVTSEESISESDESSYESVNEPTTESIDFPRLLNEFKPNQALFSSPIPVSTSKETLSAEHIHTVVKGYRNDEERALTNADDCNRYNNYVEFCEKYPPVFKVNNEFFPESIDDNPFLELTKKYEEEERFSYTHKVNPDLYTVEDLEEMYTGCDNPPTKEELDIRNKLSEYYLRVPYKQDVGVNKYPIDDYLSWYEGDRLTSWAESRDDYGKLGYFGKSKKDGALAVLKNAKELYLLVGYGTLSYMFIAETNDNELYLLHNHYAQKLDMPLSYYLNNMSEYYDLVRDDITPYFEHLNYIKYRLCDLKSDARDSYRHRFEFDAEYKVIKRFEDEMRQIYPHLSDNDVASFIRTDYLSSKIEAEADGNLLRLNDRCALCLDPFTGMLLPLEIRNDFLWVGLHESVSKYYTLDKFISKHFIKLGAQAMAMRDSLFKTPFGYSWNEKIVIDAKLGLFSDEEIEGWKKDRVKSDATSSILYKMRLLEDMYSNGVITYWSDDVFKKHGYNPI